VPGWMRRCGEGRLAVWAGHEGAFDADPDGRADNDEFRWRLLEWLRAGKGRVGFTSSHGEWLRSGGFSHALAARLRAAGAFLGDMVFSVSTSSLPPL
jgi:hypothetical protein